MGGAEEIVAQVRAALEEEFRGQVRSRLLAQPVEWLVDELVRLLLPSKDGEHPTSRRAEQHSGDAEVERDLRAARLRALSLNGATLAALKERYQALDREALERDGHLLDPPPKGGVLISPHSRSDDAEALLREAKDVLYALLFGGEDEGVQFERVQRELLTLTVPVAKLHAIDRDMLAATEISAQGTWRDPENAANDQVTPNVMIEIEYGEVADRIVGHGIAACLCLINNLEINEQILYGRMERVEESTLEP